MATDPLQDLIAKTGASSAKRSAVNLANLERRVTALEAASPRIQVSNGAPANTPREGTAVVDRSVPRLGLYVAASATRFWWVNLT